MPNPLSSVNNLVSWFDRYQRKHSFLGFLYAVTKKAGEDEAGYKAALLAYYGFLSLFPLLLVLTSTLKLILRNNAKLNGQIMHGVATYFPVIGHDLQQNVHGIGKTGLALAIGTILTLFGARGVADVFRNSLDHIWHVPHAKRSNFFQSILRSLGIILIGGLGLVLTPILSSYALGFGHNAATRWLAIILSVLILFGVLICMIKIGVSARRAFRDIWVGAAIAAVSIEILQSVGGYIVARQLKHLDTLYGTFAIVLGLLYWIYLQAQVLLYALEIDTVRFSKLWPRSLKQPLTAGDERAFKLYTERAAYQTQETLPKPKT